MSFAGSGKKPGALFLPPTINLQAKQQPPERCSPITWYLSSLSKAKGLALTSCSAALLSRTSTYFLSCSLCMLHMLSGVTQSFSLTAGMTLSFMQVQSLVWTPMQANISRVEQGGVAREGGWQLRHSARPAAMEPLALALSLPTQQVAQARALVQPLPLAHLRLRQPLALPLLQQVRIPDDCSGLPGCDKLLGLLYAHAAAFMDMMLCNPLAVALVADERTCPHPSSRTVCACVVRNVTFPCFMSWERRSTYVSHKALCLLTSPNDLTNWPCCIVALWLMWEGAPLGSFQHRTATAASQTNWHCHCGLLSMHLSVNRSILTTCEACSQPQQEQKCVELLPQQISQEQRHARIHP